MANVDHLEIWHPIVPGHGVIETIQMTEVKFVLGKAYMPE